MVIMQLARSYSRKHQFSFLKQYVSASGCRTLRHSVKLLNQQSARFTDEWSLCMITLLVMWIDDVCDIHSLLEAALWLLFQAENGSKSGDQGPIADEASAKIKANMDIIMDLDKCA